MKQFMKNEYITDDFGNKTWYLNDKIHRVDNPAVEMKNGDKFWIQHGLYHRADGPAIEFANGKKYWFYQGKLINCSYQEDFERLIKLKLLW